MIDLQFNLPRAIQWLLKFLAIDGVTGKEKAIGEAVAEELRSVGVPRRSIRWDDAHKRISLPTETGNLVVTLPGTRRGDRKLFMTHLDTVPLCAGVKPVRKGDRIVAAGETALGGDNRTGVACLVNLAATLMEKELPHPPLTLLFTVREESGLWGARFVNRQMLGNAVEGFNVDGGAAEELTLGAVGAERWEAAIHGKAAHAGAHPERGISASIVASLALAQVFHDGWFGKIRRQGKEGTANVGSISGKNGVSAGTATNVVTDYVSVRGEARSHDPRFVRAITLAYRAAFRNASRQVRDAAGKHAKVLFQTRRDYHPFRIKPTAAVVRHARSAAEAAGLIPETRISNGGLDANWLVRHGIPTITFGAGQNNIHAIGEYVDLPKFDQGCRMALAVATLGMGD